MRKGGLVLAALAVAHALVATPSKKTKDTVVIVRTHRPSEDMKRRVLQIAEDVTERLPAAHMLVSVDATDLHGDDLWKVPLPDENVHKQVWDDVKSHFPAVPWDFLGWEYPKFQHYRADGRTYHMETIVLDVEFVKKHVHLQPDAKVWVLEDDVLVCGNFSDIVDYYKADDSDLLTAHLHNVTIRWFPATHCSKAFASRYPLDTRNFAMQFVERFSTRFLEHIHKLSKHSAVTAQSEMFAPTVCVHDGFKHGFFDPQHYGDNTSWYFNVHLNKRNASEICKRRQPSMHHAVKFDLKEALQ